MYYPDDFIRRCKEVYPTFTRLHELLDCGGIFAGRVLDDSRYGSVSNKDILNAESLEDLTELKERAELVKKKNALYSEWCDLYDKEFKS